MTFDGHVWLPEGTSNICIDMIWQHFDLSMCSYASQHLVSNQKDDVRQGRNPRIKNLPTSACSLRKANHDLQLSHPCWATEKSRHHPSQSPSPLDSDPVYFHHKCWVWIDVYILYSPKNWWSYTVLNKRNHGHIHILLSSWARAASDGEGEREWGSE